MNFIEKAKWYPKKDELLVKGFNYMTVNNFQVSKSWMVNLYLSNQTTKIAWNVRYNSPRSEFASKGKDNALIRLNPYHNWALFIRAEVDRYQETIEFEHVFTKHGTYLITIYELSDRRLVAFKLINVIE